MALDAILILIALFDGPYVFNFKFERATWLPGKVFTTYEVNILFPLSVIPTYPEFYMKQKVKEKE